MGNGRLSGPMSVSSGSWLCNRTARLLGFPLVDSRVSITQDVYFGRGSGSRRAADVLGTISGDDPKRVG